MSGARGTLRYRSLIDALASLRSPVYFDEPRPTVRGAHYREHGPRGIAPRYDEYVPARATDATRGSVVLVHGGGFTLGTRDMVPMRFLASRLVAAGLTVCSVDYRLIFRGGRLDEALDDVRAALDHWRVRSERVHGLDPGRVSLVGLSAGATLAMLVAAREPVHRLACGFGLYELDHLEAGLASVVPRLLFRTPDRAVWRARSPRYAPQPPAPTLLLHGDADGLVPVAQAHRLAAHRASLGLPTRLVVYRDAPHGFFQFACDASREGAAEIVRHVSA